MLGGSCPWYGTMSHWNTAITLSTLESLLTEPFHYKQHVQKVKGKVGTRNNLLRKLANSSWRCQFLHAEVNCSCVVLLCSRICLPCMGRSSHARKLMQHSTTAADASLAASSPRMWTACTPWPASDVRRTVASRTERSRQVEDTRHPLYSHQPVPTRLKSRKSFLHTVQPLSQPPHSTRVILWEDKRCENHHHEKLPIPTKEQLPPWP